MNLSRRSTTTNKYCRRLPILFAKSFFFGGNNLRSDEDERSPRTRICVDRSGDLQRPCLTATEFRCLICSSLQNRRRRHGGKPEGPVIVGNDRLQDQGSVSCGSDDETCGGNLKLLAVEQGYFRAFPNTAGFGGGRGTDSFQKRFHRARSHHCGMRFLRHFRPVLFAELA